MLAQNVRYHFDFIGDKLIIGKFCSIASGVTCIMSGGNHHTDWLTNYPYSRLWAWLGSRHTGHVAK